MRIIFTTLILFFGSMSLGWTEQTTPSSTMNVIDVGNKTCPVSGDKVSAKAAYIYQGKLYHCCCMGCVKKFQKDPEKFIAKMEKKN